MLRPLLPSPRPSQNLSEENKLDLLTKLVLYANSSAVGTRCVTSRERILNKKTEKLGYCTRQRGSRFYCFTKIPVYHGKHNTYNLTEPKLSNLRTVGQYTSYSKPIFLQIDREGQSWQNGQPSPNSPPTTHRKKEMKSTNTERTWVWAPAKAAWPLQKSKDSLISQTIFGLLCKGSSNHHLFCTFSIPLIP